MAKAKYERRRPHVFFFSSRRRHTRFSRDWSSDVCSSDLPVVCGFIGASIIGVGPYRTGIVVGFIAAVIHYLLTLIGVFVVAFIIDTLAEMFGGRKNFASAFKVAAYAPTAAWVAGVFALLPVLSILTILGLYSLYLFYLGLPGAIACAAATIAFASMP